MGKKGKGQQQQQQQDQKKKAKEPRESNEEFNKLLAQLAETTQKNEALQQNRPVSKKQAKKERKEKLNSIKQMNAENEKRMERIRQFFEMMQRQQLSEYLEEPKKEKEVETKESDKYLAASIGMQGWRRSMEDAHIINLAVEGKEDVAIFAVFDGHSGDETAKYAAENLVRVLSEQEGWKSNNFEDALTKGFMALDKELREKEIQAGSTATVCLIHGNDLYCANAGDSRSVLCHGGEAMDLSRDHSPTVDSEKERIEKAGATVDPQTGRVNGQLAVSRGFGDFQYKGNKDIPDEEQAVTAFPEVTKSQIDENSEFLILACDGIWDCQRSKEVTDYYRKAISASKGSPDLAAIGGEIMDSILAPRGGMLGADNMSIVAVQFKR